MQSNGKTIQVSYTTGLCQPDQLKVHVTHSFRSRTPKTSIDTGMVELTELEPCILYEIQLIAIYQQFYYSVSDVKRTTVNQGSQNCYQKY